MGGGLLILSDAAVRDLLTSLSRDETLHILDQLAHTLQEYSTTEERRLAPDSVVVTRPHAKTLFRPFTSPENVGVKIVVDPSAGTPAAEAQDEEGRRKKDVTTATLHGILAVCDKDGLPVGFMNADELTGYRTAMSVMIPYMWRARTARIVVFGAGKQALWHIRLALVLRGEEVEDVTVVNRSVERLEALVTQLRGEQAGDKRGSSSRAQISGLSSMSSPEYAARLREKLAAADVVFCTTPSKEQLFDARDLVAQDGRRAGVYVSSVGAWQPDMIELDPELLRDAVEENRDSNPLGGSGGFIVTDDREESLRSSGEVIRSKLGREHLIEVGEILGSGAVNLREGRMPESLSSGLLVYKSIGVSATDLAAATAVFALARTNGKGVAVDDF